jgi:hypothetical protein
MLMSLTTNFISHIKVKEGYLIYGIWDNMLFLHTLQFYLLNCFFLKSCWLTVTKNWLGWFDFCQSSEHEESLYKMVLNFTRIYSIIWYKKSGKEFSEISCQDCVGRTKCFDEASAFQYNPEMKCENIWWKSSISETWMSQLEI